MKVAIATPPVPDDIVHPMPLLGPAVLRGHLRACGIEADLVDLTLRARNADRWRWSRAFDLDLFYPRPELLRQYLDGCSQLSFTRRGKSTTRFVRRGHVTAIKAELRNYKRLQKMIDKWIELEMRLSEMRMEAAAR